MQVEAKAFRRSPSLTQSLSPSFTHSLSSSCTHSLSPSFTHSLSPSLTHSLSPSFTHSLSPSLPLSLSPSLHHILCPSLTHSLASELQPATARHDHPPSPPCRSPMIQRHRDHTRSSSSEHGRCCLAVATSDHALALLPPPLIHSHASLPVGQRNGKVTAPGERSGRRA